MECKDRLEFALVATSTGMWSFNRTEARLSCDDGLRRLWGFAPEEPVSLERFLGAVQEADAKLIATFIEDGGDAERAETWATSDIQVRIKRLDTGADRWIAMRGRHVVVDATSEVIGTARDVTDAKLHDAQVHMLMREVTHRSKNLLAIIQAMARQTVKHSLTAADFEERFSARLRGLAFSHEILASQDWRGASVSELVHGHLRPLMEHHASRIRISGPIVFIRPEAAQNIGLALNELSTNAQKFGALAGESGFVSLDWGVDADETGPQWLRFVWRETGVQQVEPPARRGFGHEVMERVVARALDGTVQTTYPPTGFQWSLRIPVAHIASDTRA
jgi:two-component sensor histidine kinase